MNQKNLQLLEGLVQGSRYVKSGAQNLNHEQQVISSLLSQRCIPRLGWHETLIEMFLHELATMDSNNRTGNVGVGEREGRLASSLASRRCYRMSHGVGRSGDIAAVQPKAIGSCLLHQICNFLVKDALIIAGFHKKWAGKSVQVFPLATGMSVGLVVSSLRQVRPPGARRVVCPRMDQKSCLKAIVAFGFIPVVVPNTIVDNYSIRMDMEALRSYILKDGGVDTVVAVVTTSSCFAPREPDMLDDVAQLCMELGVPHVVNNAYGVQCASTVHLINRACTLGRVDAIVQSTDKNFMVPVGASVVCGPDEDAIERVRQIYPGRASSSHIIDLVITLLSLGGLGYRDLLEWREELVPEFKSSLSKIAEMNGEKLLPNQYNNISFAISLSSLDPKQAVELGSMLHTRGVTGVRVVVPGVKSTVAGINFCGFGTHVDNFPCAYLTAACAIGITSSEMSDFFRRLSMVFKIFKRRFGSGTQSCPTTKDTGDGQCSLDGTLHSRSGNED